jgi:hypothetical protein
VSSSDQRPLEALKEKVTSQNSNSNFPALQVLTWISHC